MESNIFIGHHCPRCNTTIGAYASIGGAQPRCAGCDGPLVAAEGGPSVKVIANARCSSCGFSAGLLSVVGEKPSCPQCGGSIGGA